MGLPRSTFYDAPAQKTDDAEIVARITAERRSILSSGRDLKPKATCRARPQACGFAQPRQGRARVGAYVFLGEG